MYYELFLFLLIGDKLNGLTHKLITSQLPEDRVAESRRLKSRCHLDCPHLEVQLGKYLFSSLL